MTKQPQADQVGVTHVYQTYTHTKTITKKRPVTRKPYNQRVTGIIIRVASWDGNQWAYGFLGRNGVVVSHPDSAWMESGNATNANAAQHSYAASKGWTAATVDWQQ